MRYLIFTLCLFAVRLTLAQTTTIARDRTEYLEQVQTMLKDDRRADKEELNELMLDFAKLWRSDSITSAEAALLYDVSDAMLQKRITSYEPWRHMLGVFMYFQINYQDTTPLALLRDFKQLTLQNPSRVSREYFSTHYHILHEQSLFYDGRLRWVFDGNFEYKFQKTPRYVFQEVDLWGKFKNDSTLLEKTSGTYFPRSYAFKGKGGQSFFTRAGLTRDSAYVDLSSYKIDVTKTDFRADSVMLHSKIYPRKPTQGYFEEKLTSQSATKENSFPRFFSYRNDIVIDDLLPGILFTGSFAMLGNRFYGGGTDTSKAIVSLSYKDTVLIKGRSNRFLLQTDMLYSENVQFSMYLKGDSIYHPKVTMRYLPSKKQLSVIRVDEGMGQGAFSNSYHNMDMKFDIMNWTLGQPLLTIGNLNMGEQSPVIFESENYYRTRRFDQLQGFSSTNPLIKLKNIRQKYGRKQVTLNEVARELRMEERAAHIFLMQMSVYGFVQYNVGKKEALLTDKIINYVLNRKGVRDFDVIQFVSRIKKGDNAQLSLEDFKMDIAGIRSIIVSDSQQVGLFPKAGKITMHKGLNFDFNGKISAGLFNFWGENLEFNYEKFRINMANVDSMRFKVKSFKANDLGIRDYRKVRTVLQELNGELLIDKSNNKSGKKYYSEYPIFKSATESYIYYDKANIFDSVYNREEFYVELEPFTIDSLDNIKTEGLYFDGTFTSANIFPQMPRRITVQKDYSLGFDMATPPSGLAAYGGKGTFTDSVFLSNKGLRGKGTIDYNLAEAKGKEFFFFPDSANGMAYAYEIGEKTGAGGHPHVQGDSVKIHWEPYQDQMYATNAGQPFEMYDDIGMKTSGTLGYGPGALRGKGKLQFLNAETLSQDYHFENRKFTSDSLAFKVRASPLSEWAFALDNAQAHVDFDKQIGDFSLNGKEEVFRFLQNQYIATMDFARWQIPQKALNLSRENSGTLSKMISVNPYQDSLRYEAERAKFYLTNNLLEGFGIPEIRVADASIFPDTGYVAIEEKAKMRTLQNAAITANRSTQYHQFLGATIDIKSRNYYSGSGDYEYFDKDGTPWPIRFHTLKSDTTGTTVGQADIALEDYFYMSPHFAYYGKAYLQADSVELRFRGKTKIETSCPMISTDWFAFESLINPQNIRIDLPEVDPNDMTKTLASGIYLSSDTLAGFAAFLSKDVSPNDEQMFFANGQLYYDEPNASYVIAPLEKQKDSTVPANTLRFYDGDCTLRGMGKMSIGGKQEPIDMAAYGQIDYNLNTDAMKLDIVLALDFLFDKEAQSIIRSNISLESDGDGSDYTRPVFETALQFLLEPKERKEFLSEVRDYGAPEELPKELRHTVLISDLQLSWTPQGRSFLSTGNIGIASLGKEFINRKTEGRFELQRRRRGDEIYMYWDVSAGAEYFWEYKRGMMRIYSSHDPFMDYIKELKIKDRREEQKGLRPFTYTIATESRLRLFLRRMQMIEEQQ